MIKRSIFKNFSIYFFLSILSIFLAITSSCSNFMDGAEVLESLEKIVEEVSAPVVTVTVGVDNPEYGTTVPSDPRELKLNKEYEIQFKPTSKFQFISWKVTCSDSSVELDKTVKIEDAKALVTKVTVLQELADGVTLSISPVVVQKLGISNYIPLEDGKENTRDSSIIITFDKPISSNSKLDKIEIVSQGDSIKEHFKTPVINGNILTIAADESNLIDLGSDKTRNITVKIPEELYYDSDDTIVPLGSAFSWTYKINSSTDVKSEITCSTVPDNGTIIPNELRKYSIGESFSISFTPKDNILFEEWSIKDSNGKDVDTSIISIDDKNSLTPIVTVHSEIKGVSIRPVVYQKLDVSSYTPLADGKENTKDTTISITFDKTISPENDVATIQITSQGESVKEYFGTPIINGNIITIAPLISNLIPFGEEKTKNITVTIPETFFYVVEGKKIQLGKEIKWTYKINTTTDRKSEITCGAVAEKGTVTPNELVKYNLGDSFDLVFTPNEHVIFKKWIIKGETEDEEVPDTVIHIDDLNSAATKVTVLGEIKGVSITPEAVILPVVVNFEPKFSYAGEPWDSDIVITFNKPMDISSFYLREENTDPESSLSCSYLYTFNYSIEDLADGTSYRPERVSTDHFADIGFYGELSRGGYYVPVISEDFKTVTFYFNKQRIGDFGLDNTPATYSKDIIFKLSKNIKDTEGISIEEQYPEGYEYEYRLINEKCKNKLEFTDLKICSGSFLYTDYDDYTYSLKENTEYFKTYKYTSTQNSNSKYSDDKTAYDGENPLEHMENNLIVLGDNSNQNPLVLTFKKNYDARVSNNIALIIRSVRRTDGKCENLIAANFGFDNLEDIYSFDYEKRVMYFTLAEYLTNDEVILPLNREYFSPLFSEDGIYELIITLEEIEQGSEPNFELSNFNIASNSYICYVGYKKNINEYIPQLEMKYKDGQLSYNKNIYIKYGDYITENGELKNYTFKYPLEVKLNTFSFGSEFDITNKYFNQQIGLSFGPELEILMQRQENENLEIIPSIISDYNSYLMFGSYWYSDFFDTTEMKFISDLSGDTEFADTVIIPNTSLSNNQKINIYQVEILTKGDKKTYIYAPPCEYIYKVSGSLPAPDIVNHEFIKSKKTEEEPDEYVIVDKSGHGLCIEEIELRNSSDYEDDVRFYYLISENDTVPTGVSLSEEILNNGNVSMIFVPSDKTGNIFVLATNGNTTSYSAPLAFDTTAPDLDAIPPKFDGEIKQSELQRDILGQYMIPVIDNEGFMFDGDSNPYVMYMQNYTCRFLGEITKRDDDVTKGYLHIHRTDVPTSSNKSTAREIKVNFQDANCNNAELSLTTTESVSDRLIYYDNCLQYYHSDDNIAWSYAGIEYLVFKDDGSLDLTDEPTPELNCYEPPTSQDGQTSLNKFLCVNVIKDVYDTSKRRCAPYMCYSNPTSVFLKHVYSDKNGVSVLIGDADKALVLVYALPKSDFDENFSEEDTEAMKNYLVREGVLCDSRIITGSQTIENIRAPWGTKYVVKVIFLDNTSQVSEIYDGEYVIQ